jgi:HlyD family secretion protein
MIFRKVALERLSSPEQLDQLLQVTNPRGWLALGALAALLLASLTWAIFGSIPTEAGGEGILLRQGGVTNLVAAEQGQVEEVLVSVGDVIAKGQVVARVRQQEMLRQIQDSRDRLADVRAEYNDLLRYAGEQERLRDRDLAQ